MSSATELAAWLNGIPTGGPNSDGRYPLTYADELTYLVYCPAAQALNPALAEQPIEVFANTASTAAATATAESDEAQAASTNAQTYAANALSSQNAAAASATAASGSATTASTEAGTATTQAGIATTQAGNAATSASAASTSAGNAATSETNAAASAAAAASSASVLPAGGTTAQFLWKLSNTNYDTGWRTLVKGDVGLSSVDNTADAGKPVSTAQQTALNLKANLASPTFTGTVGGITKTMVGLGSVDNTADTAKPVSTAQQTALNLKANLASPTFTGTVGGITATMVGLGSVNNTADSAKPVSTAQQTALNLKANLADPTFTGTVNAGAIAATSAISADGTVSSGTTDQALMHGYTDTGVHYNRIRAQATMWGSPYTELLLGSNGTLALGGNSIYHAGNFTPANYATLVLPQNVQNADYNTVAADTGSLIVKGDATARTHTIVNANHAAGTMITFSNDNATSNQTIAISGATMYLAGTTTTGSRTLAPRGLATAIKVQSTWYISGSGLT